MTMRFLAPLFGLGLSAFGGSAVPPVLSLVVGQTTPIPPGLTGLFTNPSDWLTTIVNAVLVNVGQKTATDAVNFMNWLLGSGNVISQTPASLSYDNPAVIRLWGTMCTAANVGLAVVAVWGGVNIIVHPQIRAPYHGALELIPRLLLSAILINTSLSWGHFVVDLNNAVCQALGSTAIPAWNLVLHPDAGTALLNIIAMGVYLLMGLLLLGQMLMRLALLDALLVIAPLALLCWVLPQTYSWARLWFSTFFGTVFVQAIQVLVLQLGSQLIQGLPQLLGPRGATSGSGGWVWLVTLLLAVAVLQLARKVPQLMPGYPAGGAGGLSLGTLRQISSLVRVGSAARGGR